MVIYITKIRQRNTTKEDKEMTVGKLTGMLTKETYVIIKDHKTRKIVWQGEAALANFNDEVKDWDFSRKHIIYI